MKIEIITIGDELLIGQIKDLNSFYICQELYKIGLRTNYFTTVGDSYDDIYAALDISLKRSNIVILTGGLGPTNDDKTKGVLCDYFRSKIVFAKIIYDDIKELFRYRGIEITEINRNQALVPDNAVVIRNTVGIAPSLLFNFGDKLIFALPGVPFEMKEAMKEVVYIIRQNCKLPIVCQKIIHTQGIAESLLAEKIREWEESLPSNISLAYLPSPGIVRLRLTNVGNDRCSVENQLKSEINKLKKIINEYIYGYDDDDDFGKVLGRLLRDKKKMLAIAESCTGGYVSHLITNVPGSSDYFKGSVIAYSNDIKENILKIDKKVIEKHGAVSDIVSREMALGVKKLFNTDCSIGITGIAGPGGGTQNKPVGLVFITAVCDNMIVTKKFIFTSDRGRNIIISGLTALNMLRKLIEQEDKCDM